MTYNFYAHLCHRQQWLTRFRAIGFIPNCMSDVKQMFFTFRYIFAVSKHTPNTSFKYK